MTVQNGEIANESTFNTSFMSRESNTNTIGEVNLENSNTTSLISLQRVVNELASSLGLTNQAATDPDANIYGTEEVVSNGDDRKVSIGKLDAQFNNSTGHSHSGAAGDGAPISAANLSNFNNLFAEYREYTFDAASGTSINVSSLFSGQSAGGDSVTEGVITTAPNNFCPILEKTTGGEIEDAQGDRVFARLTEAAGVFTLSFFTNEAGVETAHSLSSQDIRFLYREVFTAANRPTIGANVGVYDTQSAVGDIPDATATQRGLVSTSAQTYAGVKEFQSRPTSSGVNLADLTTAETFQNKTLDSTNIFSGSVINPARLDVKKDTEANLITYALTATDGQLVFATDTQTLYQVINNALEPAGGGGSGGGGGALNFNDIPLAENDDIANYTEGSDPTFDNGGSSSSTFSISSSASDVILGSASYKLVLNATPGNSDDDFVSSNAKSIPQGYRGRNLVFKIAYNYNGQDNDLKFVLKDNTNNSILRTVDLPRFTNLENTAQDFSFTFFCPDDCDAIKFGPQVSTHSAGSEELVYNFVQISPDLLITADLDNNEPWEVWTTASSDISSGFGATTDVEGYYRYVGDTLHGALTWRNGTTNSAIASVTLPNGERIKEGLGNLYQVVGDYNNSNATTDKFNVVARSGDTVVHPQRSSTMPFSPQTTVSVYNNNEYNALNFIVPIEGRAPKSTNIISPNEVVQPVKYTLSSSQVISASTDVPITFDTKVTDRDNLVQIGPFNYLVKREDVLEVTCQYKYQAFTLSSGETFITKFRINGADYSAREKIFDGNDPSITHSDLIPVKRGDIIDIVARNGSAGGATIAADPTTNFVNIKSATGKSLVANSLIRTAYIGDERPLSSISGTATAGSFQTRTINTLRGDTSFISVASNQFTLEPGEYDLDGYASCYKVNENLARIQNITDGVTEITGSAAYSPAVSDNPSESIIKGPISISSPKTFEVQHRVITTRNSNGFGLSHNISGNEVFMYIKNNKEVIVYKGKDKATWQSEINGYTWESNYLDIMERLYPDSFFDIGDIQNSVGEDLYNQITPYQIVGGVRSNDTKLVWADVQAEVPLFIADELAKIDRVFIVIELFDWGGATREAGVLNTFNSFQELLAYTEENDNSSDLALVEAADIAIKADYDKKIAINEEVKRANHGRKVIGLISYLNKQNNITINQVETIYSNSSVSSILKFLEGGSLETAKGAIQALDLTGLEPMDASYKTEAIAMIDEYLGV